MKKFGYVRGIIILHGIIRKLEQFYNKIQILLNLLIKSSNLWLYKHYQLRKIFKNIKAAVLCHFQFDSRK